MVATPSQMIPLGTKAPAFELQDTISGEMISLDEIKSEKGTVVMFICNHCPYVKHVSSLLPELANEYMEKGISFVAISSNDVESYPDDSPDNMKKFAEEHNFPFPYLFDESQEVARAYSAVCTPDTFVFDGNMELVYRGQLDASRPKNDIPVTGKDIRAALDALLRGEPISQDQKPSIGCSIKWKA